MTNAGSKAGANGETPADLRPVKDGEEIAHWNAVAAKLRNEEAKRSRRETLKSFALILAAPAVASGWVAWALKPRIEQRTEFIPIREDGTPARAYRLEDLPPEAQRDMAVNALWNYVYLRESFSSGTAEYAWRVVSAMSDERVRTEYQAAYNIRNPQSPWAIFGTKGTVKIDYDSHDDLAPPEGYSGPPPGYAFRFWRTEQRDGMPPIRAMWGASVRFRRNVTGIDPRQRYEFNAPGVQVWEYPGARPVGPQALGRQGR